MVATTQVAANEAADTPFLQWRDVTDDLGLRVQTLEVIWFDESETKQRSIVEIEDGSFHTMFGPDLDDVAALTLASDLRRHAENERTRYFVDGKLIDACDRAAEACKRLARELGHDAPPATQAALNRLRKCGAL